MVAFLEGLTAKQRKFVAEYVRTGNATKSYLNAGYKVNSEKSASAAASQILRNIKVKKAINEKMAEIESHKIMDAVEYLETLTAIARCETTEEQLANNGDVVTLKTRTSDRLAALRELGKRFPVTEFEQKATLQKLKKLAADARISEAKAKALEDNGQDIELLLDKMLDTLAKEDLNNGSE